MKKTLALALISLAGVFAVVPAMAGKGKHCDCEKCHSAGKSEKDCDCKDEKCTHHKHHAHKDAPAEGQKE